MAFFWPIFEFITQFVYQFYATEEGLYFLRGRDWQTAFIPVSLAVVALLLKGRLLRQNPQNGALVHLAVCTGLLFILTCQHYIFQRIGNIFFAGAIFLLPELLKGIRIEPAADEDLEQRRFQMRVRTEAADAGAPEEEECGELAPAILLLQPRRYALFWHPILYLVPAAEPHQSDSLCDLFLKRIFVLRGAI